MISENGAKVKIPSEIKWILKSLVYARTTKYSSLWSMYLFVEICEFDMNFLTPLC